MGLTLAAIGVTLVVWRKLEAGFGTMEGVLLCVLALCGITAATLYQKRFCGAMDLRSGSVIQYTAAGLAAGLGSFIVAEQRIDWTEVGRAKCRVSGGQYVSYTEAAG